MPSPKEEVAPRSLVQDEHMKGRKMCGGVPQSRKMALRFLNAAFAPERVAEEEAAQQRRRSVGDIVVQFVNGVVIFEVKDQDPKRKGRSEVSARLREGGDTPKLAETFRSVGLEAKESHDPGELRWHSKR